MPHRFPLATALVVAGLCSAACDPGQEPVPGGSAEARAPSGNPLGFEVWHADFPCAPDQPHLSPRRPGRWYDSTPQQALESIVAHLQGNCSRDAWLVAKEFFARVDPDDLDPLVAALDRALQVPERVDLVENAIEALGRSGSDRGAPALIRALEHPRTSIRNKVMQALAGGGNAAAVRQAATMFDSVDGRGMEGWIRAAVAHLPPAEAAASFRELLLRADVRLVQEVVVANALRLPIEHALQVFEPLIGREPPELAATIAALRHAAGDAGGTALVVDHLGRPEPQARLAMLQALQIGGAEHVLDRVLPLSTDPDPRVRMAVVELVTGLSGERVDLTLEAMAVDEAVDVRRAALAALVARGRPEALDELLDIVRRGTGTRVTLAVQDLVAARYGGAVPVLVERMERAPADERFDYLRAIALSTTAEAFEPLRAVFLAEDAFAVEHRGEVAYLMANCRGAEAQMLALTRALPKADHRRRALMFGTLANIAADRETDAVARPVYALFREILADGSEIPQLRLLALEYLRRDLRLEDMRTIKRMAADESEPMRRALMDFLFEFY